MIAEFGLFKCSLCSLGTYTRLVNEIPFSEHLDYSSIDCVSAALAINIDLAKVIIGETNSENSTPSELFEKPASYKKVGVLWWSAAGTARSTVPSLCCSEADHHPLSFWLWLFYLDLWCSAKSVQNIREKVEFLSVLDFRHCKEVRIHVVHPKRFRVFINVKQPKDFHNLNSAIKSMFKNPNLFSLKPLRCSPFYKLFWKI